ncbi:proline-rich membrane anchor 1 isoform X1 [Mobula hypostoma]|uniref:proline-rich membrane anchor 1 isoform X1 n=1 Tax=Mobula hypostoma TaxID=723540 RepID=UPI002FC384B2
MQAAELPQLPIPCPLNGYITMSLIFIFQLSQGELQKSGGESLFETEETTSCHEVCSCRPPPLPPPPPPPPPPRQSGSPIVKPTDYPPLKPWWTDMVIVIAVGCATLAFLVVAVIICYKAIKRQHWRAALTGGPTQYTPGSGVSIPAGCNRKPMRKEENGTSRTEYAMTSQNNKMVDRNSVLI